MGNISFKVVNDPAFLKFYPEITSTGAIANGIITGKVTDALSTLPIANAEVTAGGITSTDAAGTYSISIAPGLHSVTVRAAGYIINTTSVTVTSGATVTRDFALQPVPQPDFTISASPSSQLVIQGASANYIVSLNSLNGVKSPVSLSVTGLPGGAAAYFNPGSVTPSGSSTLAIQISSSTPAGFYTITITGTAGVITHSTTVTLFVSLFTPPPLTGQVWDESLGSPLPFTWDYTNFPGFNVNGMGTERLTVVQPDLSHSQRTINNFNLVYSTAAQQNRLPVVDTVFSGNVTAAATAGLLATGPGQGFNNGNYDVVYWQAERYVALNGKIDKLSKLILEQGTLAADRRTLTVGETWDIGDGWTLTVNSIDARATPRSVWLTLNKDGVKRDDKNISSGTTDSKPIYTYVEKNLAGETDVPVLVTFVDSIFAGATVDMIQLRYTWLISSNVTIISSGDTYGVFKDANVNGSAKSISLRNSDTSLTLSPNATINLMGNMNFKVIDDPAFLKFYPAIGSQSANGAITGRVTNDSLTIPIANAYVTADGITATTDAAGIYTISIAPGLHSMTASAAGYIVNMTSVTVTSGATITRDFALQPAVAGKGDCSGDGKVDIVDALFIAQSTVGLRTLGQAQYAAADVSGDAKVDIVDALFIAQATVGLRQL